MTCFSTYFMKPRATKGMKYFLWGVLSADSRHMLLLENLGTDLTGDPWSNEGREHGWSWGKKSPWRSLIEKRFQEVANLWSAWPDVSTAVQGRCTKCDSGVILSCRPEYRIATQTSVDAASPNPPLTPHAVNGAHVHTETHIRLCQHRNRCSGKWWHSCFLWYI